MWKVRLTDVQGRGEVEFLFKSAEQAFNCISEIRNSGDSSLKVYLSYSKEV